jgi:hypothetical protein
MSVTAPPPALTESAKRVARRAGLRRRGPKRQPPRLRVASRSTGAPTLWMVTPDWDHPAGGVRKQYRAVDVLNEAGLSAAVVHRRPGFKCTWFEHETRVVAAAEISVGTDDLIAVPEIFGASILDLPAGVRNVIFNQGAYLALDTLVAGGEAAAAPYVDNPDLAAVVVVSDDSAEVVRYMFPDAPVHRIRHGLDPAVHHPPVAPRRRRIAYMSRRRGEEADQVLWLLERRGVLDDWEVVRIKGKSELEVAELLRSAQVFLSFSQLEGFGMPPLEALACGCLVVGFNGFGGRELFHAPFAVAVEDSDVVGFARAVEDVLRRIDAEPLVMSAAATAGSRFALETYSREEERRSLLEVFAPLLHP